MLKMVQKIGYSFVPLTTICQLTDIQTDRKTDRQTDRQTDGKANGHVDGLAYVVGPFCETHPYFIKPQFSKHH